MIPKNNIDIYPNNIQQNIDTIRNIIQALGFNNFVPLNQYSKILSSSAYQITQKWLSGRKYCRTLFIQQAFQKFYPNQHTLISLQIDALVNILDDLLDENLEKGEKTLYVLEFLRVFSLHENNCPEKFKQLLGRYINQLITLAIAEEYYQKMVQQENNIEKIIQWSINLLLCRGMDINIFTEIALSKLELPNNEKDFIKTSAQVFRANNILKKDIDDIKHDQKNSIKTMVTLILSKNEIEFSSYLTKVSNHLFQKIKSILYNQKPTLSPITYSIINNLYQMTTNEQKIISSYGEHID